jgi:hypothetical protein
MTTHEGDDLPDWDYESIYGREMLRIRQRAQDQALLRHAEALDAKFWALRAQLAEQRGYLGPDATMARLKILDAQFQRNTDTTENP